MTNDDGRQQVALAHRVIVTPRTLALGLAWERVEKALPELFPQRDSSGKPTGRWGARSGRTFGWGPTPADALNALADALEAQK